MKKGSQFLLTKKEFEKVQSLETTSLNELSINELIYLINLCEEVAGTYAKECDDSFEHAVRGMRYGLIKYRDYRMKDKKGVVPLDAYLTWFMKCSIEFSLGWDNEDVQTFVKSIESMEAI